MLLSSINWFFSLLLSPQITPLKTMPMALFSLREKNIKDRRDKRGGKDEKSGQGQKNIWNGTRKNKEFR